MARSAPPTSEARDLRSAAAAEPEAVLARSAEFLVDGDLDAGRASLLPLLSAQVSAEYRARALVLSAQAEGLGGSTERAETLLAEARFLIDQEGIPGAEAEWYLVRMGLEIRACRLSSAEACGQAALYSVKWRQDRASDLRARAWYLMGTISARRCEWKAAERRFGEALVDLRTLGHRDRLAVCLLNFAQCLFRMGRWAEAEKALREAAGWFGESGNKKWEASCDIALAMVSLASANLQAARSHLDRARQLAGEAPALRLGALMLEVSGDLDLLAGRFDKALVQYSGALDALGDSSRDVITEILYRRADTLTRLNRPEEAYKDAQRAVELAREITDPIEEVASLRARGLAAAALGRQADARKDLESAFAKAAGLSVPFEEARCAEALGQLLGSSEGGALACYESMTPLLRARSLYAALGCTKAVARIDKILASRDEHTSRPSPRRSRPRAQDADFLTQDARILEDLRRLRRLPGRVLLQGETGTGKELIAKLLHRESDRSAGPFIVVDCGAIAKNIFESELFGFRRGTFTGADQDREGLIQSADGGTLFLDEVSELPMELQSRFLRVLQERQSRRLGDTAYHPVDFRLVAATNRDLERMVSEGTFRSDLYYRLAGTVMIIPPLRERRADVVLLARHFLAGDGGPERDLEVTPDVYETLRSYDWPGNVRELISVVENLAAAAREGFVTSAMLPPKFHAPQRSSGDEVPTLAARLDAVRRAEVLSAVQRHGGSLAAAARELGVSRYGLSKMLRRLQPPKHA